MKLGNSIIAGLAGGSLMGVFFVGVAVLVIASRPSAAARLAHASFRGMSTIKASIIGSIGVVACWMLLGTALGLIHYVMGSAAPGGGIGSPTAAYTVGVVGLATGFTVIVGLFKRPYFGPVVAISMGFAATFGWLLPWLAY